MRSGCRTCGVAFSSLSGFDAHLRWSKGPPWVSHLSPGQVGLVEAAGVWKHPNTDREYAPRSAAKSEGMATYLDGDISPYSADVPGCRAS